MFSVICNFIIPKISFHSHLHYFILIYIQWDTWNHYLWSYHPHLLWRTGESNLCVEIMVMLWKVWESKNKNKDISGIKLPSSATANWPSEAKLFKEVFNHGDTDCSYGCICCKWKTMDLKTKYIWLQITAQSFSRSLILNKLLNLSEIQDPIYENRNKKCQDFRVIMKSKVNEY